MKLNSESKHVKDLGKRRRKKNLTITKGDKCPAICKCDLDLGPTRLKCELVQDIVIIHFV